MDVLILMFGSFIGYIVMYRLYGKFLSKKIFKLKSENEVPSNKFDDGVDYQPTKKEILFGHHFTSIAGTGPIVGPAIAVIWGWLPALLWVFFGSIIIGGVHDFGTLVVSLRNEGKTLADYSNKYIGKYGHTIIFIIAFLMVWMVLAIFGMVISIIFDIFPGAVLPIWLQIPIAVVVGYMINHQGKSNLLWSFIGIVLLYGTVILGAYTPIQMPTIAGIAPTGTWTAVLLIYAFIASVLPVKTLLQPRDYINSHQLVIAMGLLFIGIIVSALTIDTFGIVAPAYVSNPEGAPNMFPFLFIIIACGAVSGFHSLVSSGTSSKQLSNEKDALGIGYGSMLGESALAVLVIIATVAGIGLAYGHDGSILKGQAAWMSHYHSWGAAQGLGSKIGAFVVGAANMIETIGVPHKIATVIMGVFVASFAATTLDTAARLQRFILQEMIPKSTPKAVSNRFSVSFVVVLTAAILAFSTGTDGTGALLLWPLFGNINQIFAMIGLVVLTGYLRKTNPKYWLVAGIPSLFMVIICTWAGITNLITFINEKNWLLLGVNMIVLALAYLLLFMAGKRITN